MLNDISFIAVVPREQCRWQVFNNQIYYGLPVISYEEILKIVQNYNNLQKQANSDKKFFWLRTIHKLVLESLNNKLSEFYILPKPLYISSELKSN